MLAPKTTPLFPTNCLLQTRLKLLPIYVKNYFISQKILIVKNASKIVNNFRRKKYNLRTKSFRRKSVVNFYTFPTKTFN